MKYCIQPNAQRAYLQLYEQLREDIVSGLLPYGHRLPSKRLLSEEVGVSIITVEHAYALLCDEGYAQARQRQGYYVTFLPGEAFSPPRSAPVPHRTDGEREGEFPFSVYARAVRKVLSDYGEENLLVKSPGTGSVELRSALSAYLARSRGIKAAPEQIVIGSGAEYLYGFVVQLLGREKLYGVEDPSYEKISFVYGAMGARQEKLPLGQDGIESEALKASCAQVLHVTPYRSFPSGVTATASKKREYLDWAEKGERFLVEDDFESEFSLSRKPEETLFSLSCKENVIYVNSFTKTIAPSIRVGYMVLPPSLLPIFEEKLGFYSCTVPLLEQRVLTELLSCGAFERHVNRVRRKKRRAEEKK